MTDKSIHNQGNGDQTPSKIFGIVAIIAGILVMISGYIVYSYFNQNSVEKNDDNEVMVRLIDPNGSIGKAASTSRFEEDKKEPDSFGITPTSSIKPKEPTDDLKPTNPEKVYDEYEPTSNVNTLWIANNYEFGDIEIGDYTVSSGDTLWEIAEAVYGNGSDWQKIADANNVDYLANGNPLIVPGQILLIPT